MNFVHGVFYIAISSNMTQRQRARYRVARYVIINNVTTATLEPKSKNAWKRRGQKRNGNSLNSLYLGVSNSFKDGSWPGAVARSEASPLGMQAALSSIPTSGTFFRGDLVMKTLLRPFSLFRWFKKSSCQLLAKECALSTGKLPRRLAQEQCG